MSDNPLSNIPGRITASAEMLEAAIAELLPSQQNGRKIFSCSRLRYSGRRDCRTSLWVAPCASLQEEPRFVRESTAL